MANIEGEYPRVERVETGFYSLDVALSNNREIGVPMTFTEIFGNQGVGKCLGKGTKVLMYDGTLVEVQDIVNGDLVMGSDSAPRKVLGVTRGKEKMYVIRQTKGISYTVNESHILSLKFSGSLLSQAKHGDVLNISVSEYLKLTNKSRWMGYKVPVEFQEKLVDIEPYFLGLWLGDGNSDSVGITNIDREVIEYLYEYAKSLGLSITETEQIDRTTRYSITNSRKPKDHTNLGSLQAKLNKIGVLNNKHIPQEYLSNTRRIRMELLAGLIDSDGYYGKVNNTYSITQKNHKLITEIKFLCDSLGLRTGGIKETWKSPTRTSPKLLYYSLNITGNLSDCPIRIKRKKQKLVFGNPRRNPLVTSITVDPIGLGEYFGFTLSGDGLFLLEDMTVTHNTTVATSLAGILAEHYKRGIAYAAIEHVDREYLGDILDGVGFKQTVSVLGGLDMLKKFLPYLKIKKVEEITDEMICDCLIASSRMDEYCVGILDSLSLISPIEETQSSTADKNMGRRGRLASVLSRGIINSLRSREVPYATFIIAHKVVSLSSMKTTTGTDTTGGEGKKNASKVRLNLSGVQEKTMQDLDDNCYIIKGRAEKMNFGKSGRYFHLAILGGKGMHRGMTALYECKVAGLASFGASITMDGKKYGAMRSIVAKAHEGDDEFFAPFMKAIRNPDSISAKVAKEESEEWEA